MYKQLWTTFALIAAVLALICVAPLGVVAGQSFQRTCFPADRWNVTDKEYRPCARITRLYEDGSFKYAVSDANGTVRYSGGVGAADR